ncbi:hypothetical protein F4779DRAFT_564009 [Xylariaceae sp. FL0662B]|nr:hypothetical protein F4779DRAFT_564009 [Xylariaceae sp. FL0662B]
MESKTASGPKPAARPEASEQRQSKLYQAIMTPINFVSFLLSLYLVNYRYDHQRAQGHYHHPSSGYLPQWLFHLLYRPQPYQWVDRGPAPPNRDDERWYYHTRQKKLFKMEAADAFELRYTLLLGLCALALAVAWLFYRLGFGLWARYAV